MWLMFGPPFTDPIIPRPFWGTERLCSAAQASQTTRGALCDPTEPSSTMPLDPADTASQNTDAGTLRPFSAVLRRTCALSCGYKPEAARHDLRSVVLSDKSAKVRSKKDGLAAPCNEPQARGALANSPCPRVPPA